MLSAVPQSHSGAVTFTVYAVLAGIPLIALADSSGPNLVRQAERHEPTTVVAFAQTFADVADLEPEPGRCPSVQRWINMGDSAHDAHVRRIITLGHRRGEQGDRRPGSVFADGLGSTELGWAVLRRIITPDTPPGHRRCMGQPEPFARLAVLRPDGTPAEAGEVGLLGVDSPTVTPGYWSDSDTYYRSRFGGYWLTGDLVHRDEQGLYYHVDRMVDTVHTAAGTGYSVQMEEIIMHALPEVADCAVVAGDREGEVVAVAVARLRTPGTEAGRLLTSANAALTAAGQPPLDRVEIARSADDFPVGPTGKVLKRRLREKYTTGPAPAVPALVGPPVLPVPGPLPATGDSND
jgi:acyl-coenzyme A synthetase/AMP-(fatty) acid ligase